MDLKKTPISDADANPVTGVADAPESEGQTVPRLYIDDYVSHVGDAAPTPPSIVTPTNDQVVEYTFEVTGVSLVGTQISVYVDDHVKGFATTGASGTWSTSVTLTDAGTFYLTAFAEGPGGLSTRSNIVKVVARAPLPGPYIEEPMNGAQLTANTDAIFAGLAPNGVTVYLYHQGEDAEIGYVLSDGTWEIQVLLPTLVVGTVSEMHNYYARYVYVSVPEVGRWSSLSNIVTINVNPQPKTNTPVVTQPTSPTNSTYVVISGTAELDARVDVYVTGQVSFTHTLHSDPSTGAWSIQTGGFTQEGSYSITCTAQVALHSISDRAVTRTLVIDRTAPAIPVYTTGGTVLYSPFTIAGTAEPNATVYLNTPVGLYACAVDGNGVWSRDGLGQAGVAGFATTIVCTDAAGNDSSTAARTWTVHAAAAPTVLPVSGEYPSPVAMSGTCLSGATVRITNVTAATSDTATVVGTGWTYSQAVTLDAAPYNFRVEQQTSWGYGDSVTVTYRVPTSQGPSVSYPAAITNLTDLVISGWCPTDAQITMYWDGAQEYQESISSNWYAHTILSATEAQHTLVVTAQEAGHAVSSPVTVQILVDRTAPSVPSITAPASSSNFVQNEPIPVSVTCDVHAANTVVEITKVGDSVAEQTLNFSATGTITSPGMNSVAGYTIRARSTDAAGNWSAWTSPVSINVLVAPITPAPTITRAPAFTKENPLVIEVTSVQNATVVLYYNTQSISGLTTLVGGVYKYIATFPDFPEGNWYFNATAQEPLHAISVSSAVSLVIVDRTGPAAPVINVNAVHNSVNPTSVTGTGEALSTITLYANGVFVGTTTATGANTWLIPWSPADGTYQMTATATDRATNVSALSSPVTYWFDRVAPLPPTINALPAFTNTTPLAVSGTASMDTVELRLTKNNAAPVYYPTLTPNAGNTLKTWSANVELVVGPATETFQAVARDLAGNASPQATASIQVNRSTAYVPTLTYAPAGDIYNATVNKTKTFSGSVKPPLYTLPLAPATIGLRVDSSWGAGPAVPAPVQSNSNGDFTFPAISFAGILANTTFTYYARQTDAYGNTSDWSLGSAVAVHIETDILAPTITQLGPQSGSAAISGQHNWVPSLDPNEAAPTISLYDNGALIASNITTTGTGSYGVRTWTSTVLNFADGTHNITAYATSMYGNVSPISLTMTFFKSATQPGAPTITHEGYPYAYYNRIITFSGTATANTTVRLMEGASVLVTTTSNSSGAWSATPASLVDGAHTFYAIAVSATGVLSPPSASRAWTLDRVAPNPPGLNPGGPYYTSTFTITGTSEGSATIRVYNAANGAYVSGGTAAANGTFSCSVAAGIGTFTYYATQTDLAGNVSGNSAPMSYVLVAPLPDTPTLNTIASPAGPSVYVSGTCNPAYFYGSGYNINVYVDGVAVTGTGYTNSSGIWGSYIGSYASGSTHTVTARSMTSGGVLSAPSTARTFTYMVTTPPVTPVITVFPTTMTAGVFTMSGTGTSGNDVYVYKNGVKYTGVAPIVQNGVWSFSETLAIGSYTYQVSAYAGYTGLESPKSPAQTVVVSATPLLTPAISYITPTVITEGTPVSVYGTGTAGGRIYLTATYVDDPTWTYEAPEYATVTAGGTWSFDPAPLDTAGPGRWRIYARLGDALGNRSAYSPYKLLTINEVI